MRTGDKRQAILAAAIRLIARSGLHATPISAIAREAGVAAGTLYLYFPSKEAMINALYLEVLEERDRAIGVGGDVVAAVSAREGFWQFWQKLARWHLDFPEHANLLNQCQASSILTAETRDAEQRMHAEGMVHFDQAVARGTFRPISLQVFWALLAGPIFVLSQMRATGEIEITDDVLEATFDGVCRSVLEQR
ncbi:MAG TPA: TetR/AcrR family transcriptional regulator [Gemmatimonadaceae bacterium]|nr:TetR/AcrR family transcriptional regulator [Gemmatimonadaceae bacterium]